MLSWSYGALPAAAQRTLILLGSANIPDADTLAASALTGQDTAATGHQLELLRSGHLLLTGAGRHSMHDLVRCFTRDVAARETSQDDRDTAVARLIAWHLHSACNARLALAPQLPPLRASLPAPARPASFGSADEALAWCEAERGNLVAVTQLAFDHGLYDAAWQLPTAWYGFLELRKHWDDWVQTHTIALKAAEQLADDEAQGRIWCNLGNAYRPRYQFDATIDCYRNALALLFFQSAGNLLDYAYTQADLMAARFARADPEAAVFHGQQAADLLAELGHHASSGQVLADLAVVYRSAGNQARARACLRQSAVTSAKASTAQREAALRLRTPLADPAKEEPND